MLQLPGIVAVFGDAKQFTCPDVPVTPESLLSFENIHSSLVSGYIGHHGTFYSSAIHENPDLGVGLILDGSILVSSDGDRYPTLDKLLKEYLKYGEAFIHGLNGAFNLLLWDQRKQTIIFANDRYGLRPVYYYQNAGAHFVAPQATHIFQASGLSKTINRDAIYNLLSYSRVFPGNGSFYENLGLLPPASILTWNPQGARVRKYWDYEFQHFEEVTPKHVDHFVDLFQCAVEESVAPFERMGLNLSGGLDSRAVLAAIPDKAIPRLDCFTWGYSPHCQEVQLASQTATAFDARWNFVELAPEDFISQAAEGIRVLDGRDMAVQSYGLKVFPQIAEKVDVSVTGLAFDLLCGGSYSSSVMSNLSTMEGSRATEFIQKYNVFSCFGEDMFRDPEDARQAINRISSQLCIDMHGSKNQHPADVVDRFAMHQRVWRYIFTRQSWQRLYVEDVNPTFDNRVVDFLLQIPPSCRANHRFYRMFLDRISPICMQIPYQRTLLPPSVPVKYWQVAADIERSREELLRKIYFDSKGRNYIKYDRYYSNFDEWFRENEGWKTKFEELLLSSDSRLCNGYVNRAWVRSIYTDHSSGKKSYYSQMISLMSAELVLRECI